MSFFSVIGSCTVSNSLTMGFFPRQWFVHATSIQSPGAGETYHRLDLTRYVAQDWQIQQSLGKPSTFNFSVYSLTPAVGQPVVVSLSPCDVSSTTAFTFGDVLFSGTVLNVRKRYDRQAERRVVSDVEAVDHTWLINRYARVVGTFGSVGYNTMVAQILDQFTAPSDGFELGYVPQSLGIAPLFTFNYDTVMDALQRIADVTDAYLSVDVHKHVHLTKRADHLSAVSTIADTSKNFRALDVNTDAVNQVREAQVLGASTRLSQAVDPLSADATTNIRIDDPTIFDQLITRDRLPLTSPAVNTRLVLGTDVRTITGVIQATSIITPSSIVVPESVGASQSLVPGTTYTTIVGVTTATPTVNRFWSQGTRVAVLGVTTSSQSLRYGTLFYEANDTLMQGEALRRSQQIINLYNSPLTTVQFITDDEIDTTFRVENASRLLLPGVTINVAVEANSATSSLYVNASSLLVTDVTISQRGSIVNSTVDISRQIRAGTDLKQTSFEKTIVQATNARLMTVRQ